MSSLHKEHDFVSGCLTDISLAEWVGRTTRMPWVWRHLVPILRLQARQALEVALQEIDMLDREKSRTYFFCGQQIDRHQQTIETEGWICNPKNKEMPHPGSGQFHSIFTSNFSQLWMWRVIVRSSSQHLKQRISVSVVPGWFVFMSGFSPIHTVVRLVHPGCWFPSWNRPSWRQIRLQDFLSTVCCLRWFCAGSASAPSTTSSTGNPKMQAEEDCNRNIVQ